MTPEVPKIQGFMRDSCPMAMRRCPLPPPVSSPTPHRPPSPQQHLVTSVITHRPHSYSFFLSAAGQPSQNSPGVCGARQADGLGGLLERREQARSAQRRLLCGRLALAVCHGGADGEPERSASLWLATRSDQERAPSCHKTYLFLVTFLSQNLLYLWSTVTFLSPKPTEYFISGQQLLSCHKTYFISGQLLLSYLRVITPAATAPISITISLCTILKSVPP